MIPSFTRAASLFPISPLRPPDGISRRKRRPRWRLGADKRRNSLANPEMIKAYLAGAPGNGKPFPNGAKMAKVHWNPKKIKTFPTATVPGTQHDVDFIVKDGKRFADSGGCGWAVWLR